MRDLHVSLEIFYWKIWKEGPEAQNQQEPCDILASKRRKMGKDAFNKME